jgi:dipeptidyl aminopeptidase/acylaminoacyl peptidase
MGNLILAQDGKIINKVPFILHDSTYSQVNNRDTALALKLRSIDFYRITYLSDGLKVTGYIAEPKEKGIYPCIISNRGGNTNFSQWNPFRIAFYLGRMASWKYVVIASQYRGNDGGEGKEEFGGKDIDDVLNLIPSLSQLPTQILQELELKDCRGGMMTYLALKIPAGSQQ